MNSIFSNNSSCAPTRLKLEQFATVPISSRLGVVEWVSNTEPLKAMINKVNY